MNYSYGGIHLNLKKILDTYTEDKLEALLDDLTELAYEKGCQSGYEGRCTEEYYESLSDRSE